MTDIKGIERFQGMQILDNKIEELSLQRGGDIEEKLENWYLIDSGNNLTERKIHQITMEEARDLKREKQKEYVKKQSSWLVTGTELLTAGLSIGGAALTGGSAFAQTQRKKDMLQAFSTVLQGTGKGSEQFEKIFEGKKRQGESETQFDKSDAEENQKKLEQSQNEANQRAQQSIAKADEIRSRKFQAMREYR